ncbi:hypothetical protein ACIQVT_09845 [Streptomyces sp. NPDC100445]|uniref:hypothetical protein n=1 Tax=Streptomyces sp. NPDC100445 TaxID=3366102 RepID=UPI00380D5D9D
MGSEQPVCPVCGQPVDTVVRRHKTLGTWVPVWSSGPCHSPDCVSRTDPAHSDPARPAGAPVRRGDGGPERPPATGTGNSAV